MMALSYSDNPLKILYAKGQYFYEENGNKVLDCINNVSHIGHCHPYYVAQMNAQNARLLTNSRFLYDELMTATNRLLKKFPKELCVVTFVNTGSEANDLASNEFGMDRLTAVLRESAALPGEQILDRIFQAIDQFAGEAPQFDDITLLVIKRLA